MGYFIAVVIGFLLGVVVGGAAEDSVEKNYTNDYEPLDLTELRKDGKL